MILHGSLSLQDTRKTSTDYFKYTPARYSVSKDIFKTLLREIRERFEELRAEHKNNNDQVWTTLH